jgi:tetratricopeptide (TPR) repeat protein
VTDSSESTAEPSLESPRWRRASRLHQAGRAAAFGYDQTRAIRRLRQALAVLGSAEQDSQAERRLRARILLILAYSEAESGRTGLGLALLDQAQELLPYAERADAHGQRAILLRRAGRESEALAEYDRAFAALADSEVPGARLRLLLNRSALFLAAVRLPQARADLDRCQALARAAGDRLVMAKADHNLGILDHLAGRLPEALRRFAEAERYYTEAAPGLVPLLRLDRARTLLAAGLFTEADAELAESVTQLAAQRASQDRAEAEYARAEAALLDRSADPSIEGGPERAARFARQAARTFRRRSNPRWTARAELLALRAEFARLGRARQAGSVWRRLAERLDVEAERLRRLGMVEDARVAALSAQRCRIRAGQPADATALTVHRGDRPDTRLLTRLTAAEVAYAAGRPALAGRRLHQGLADLGRIRTLLGALDLQTGTAALGRELAETGLAAALHSGRPATIFAWSELARAQALLAHRPTPRLDPTVVDQVEELRGIELELQRAEIAGRTAPGLQSRRERLRRELREHTRLVEGTGRSYRMISWAQFRQQLGETAAVVLMSTAGRLAAMVAAGGRVRLVDLAPLAAVEELVARLRADLDALAGRAPGDRVARVVSLAAAADASALDRNLLEPLLSLIGDRPLLVVPTRSLITVPWSVLPSCRGRAITVTPSATIWVRARGRSPVGPPRRALLVDGPRVPRAAAEIGQLAKVLAGHGVQVTALTGRSATPAATLEALPEVDLAHFICHGRHAVDNVLFSGLELSTGPLMGYDLQQRLDRTPPWVVLSACDVGLHDVRPGDESLGLASALLASGTATVLASVCQVGDEAAWSLMDNYYQQLLDGSAPAEALAAATTATPGTGMVCFGAG